MKFQKRVLCLLALLSLSFLVIGCWLNDDDDDQFVAATGAIKLSAVADAGAGNAFAASMREAAAGIRGAAASNKFLANIKIGASRHRTLTLERSDNGQTLTLDATIDGVGAGKQQVTIEIVASGVADPEPILKTITTATVAAGQTNEGDIKNAPINYETTAKAIAYEAWPASSSKTIDDFAPPPASITALASTIQATLGGSIDGTKTLNDSTIKEEAVKVAEAVSNTPPAAVTPSSITLNPGSGSVAANESFNLASVVVTAKYSDNSTKAVTGYTWTIKSGGGSISGSTYTPPTTAGNSVLTCTFTENGVTKTAAFTITVTSVQPTLVSIELSRTYDSVAANATYNLANVLATATYSDLTTRAITGYNWTITSGGGTISGLLFTPPSTTGTTVLKFAYTENGLTQEVSFWITITAAVRFAKDSDGVITDSETGLQWYCAPEKETEYNWYEARDLAASFAISGGFWRLATLSELKRFYADAWQTGLFNCPVSWTNDIESLGEALYGDSSEAWCFNKTYENEFSYERYAGQGKSFLLVRSMMPGGVTGVSLNKGSSMIEKGTSESLSVIFTPIEASNKIVTWTSSNMSIATVDNSGLVTGVSAGKATILVTSEDGHCTAQCLFTVIGDRFSIDSEGVITDKQTNMQWFFGDRSEYSDQSWYSANAWISGLTVGGGGWRMPTMNELRGLKPDAPLSGLFPFGDFWSSDVEKNDDPSTAKDDSSAWFYAMSGYYESWDWRFDSVYVLYAAAVRTKP